MSTDNPREDNSVSMKVDDVDARQDSSLPPDKESNSSLQGALSCLSDDRPMAMLFRACLVIVGGVFVHLTLGTLYTFGNLSPYMTSYLRNRTSSSDITYGESVWINALAASSQGLTMFFGGFMEQRIGPRLTVLCGAWFQSLGVALTYFAIQHSFAAAMITYGVMFGSGVGIAYAVPMAVGMRWLPHRKGLVNGCIVAGFGGGAFIFDQIQTVYINPDNMSPNLHVHGEQYFTQPEVLDKVPTMFLILGGTYAALQLLGCLLLTNPPDFPTSPTCSRNSGEHAPLLGPDTETSIDQNIQTSSDDEEEEHHTTRNDSVEELHRRVPAPAVSERTLTPREMVHESGFYILWFIFVFNGQGVNFISSLYKAFGQTFIKDDMFLAWVGTLAAVCNASGRIIWGTLADKFSFKVAMLCLCCLFTSLMLTFGLTGLGGRWMFLLWVCLLFLAFSGNFSLMPTACARSFGQEHYPKNYGLLFTSQMITSPISAVLTSSLQIALGWYGMFYMVAGFSFVSFLLTMAFNVKMQDGKDV